MRASLLAMLLLLGACATQSGGSDASAESDNPAALLDAYAVAHGMAVSYASSRNALPAVVAQLARLDARAAQAVVSLQRMPSGFGEEQAGAAVAALTSFAARQADPTP